MNNNPSEMENQSENQFLGKVTKVSADQVIFHYDLESSGKSNQFNDHLRIGKFLIIPGREYINFGQISDINLLTDQEPFNKAEVKVQLLLSINTKTAKVVHGIVESVQIGARVLLAHNDIIKLVSNPASLSKGETVSLLLANLQNVPNIPVSITPEILFGRHCAIIGTTGAGKSWTVARILEETSRFQSKVILFDATGEYQELSERVRHVYLGQDSNPLPYSEKVVLPFYNLTENDLFAIFQPNAEIQAPKLRAAIKSLKLAYLKPDIAVGGRIVKANRSKAAYEKAYQEFYHDLNTKDLYFEIEHLSRQIENECVAPSQSAVDTNAWGAADPNDRSACLPLISRIEEMIRSETLAPIFQPQRSSSLLQVFDDFLEDESKSILRISLEFLSYDHHARELITNVAGRYLLNLARQGDFKRNPTLLILDEAHQFLNLEINNEDLTYALDSFAIIAKEGRKYGLNLCIATQRPRDIPEGVISQMGTLIVHRLINDYDRNLVERACGQLDHRTVQMLPNLSSGEAILVNAEYPIPLMIKILPATARPNSAGPNYQNYWRTE